MPSLFHTQTLDKYAILIPSLIVDSDVPKFPAYICSYVATKRLSLRYYNQNLYSLSHIQMGKVAHLEYQGIVILLKTMWNGVMDEHIMRIPPS